MSGVEKNRDTAKDKGNSGNKIKRKKNVVQIAEELFSEIIKNLGYELWNIEYYKEPTEWILEVTIDKEGGISIDDCEKVHRAIGPVIDEADPIENSYSLVVSSPGLDRELKKDFHFERYLNAEVSIKLFAKHELLKEKTFRGTLLEYKDGNLKIAVQANGGKPINNGNKEDTGEKVEILLSKKEIAHIYAYDEIDI